MARVLHSNHGVVTPLDSGWQVAFAEPGRALDPAGAAGLVFSSAPVPGTAAMAMAASGRAPAGRDLDAQDTWYRCRFAHQARKGARALLSMRGLATVADVWLNGQLVARSDNMFHEHAIDVTTALRADNELSIRFVAIATVLGQRRPRPRWKTRLVAHQQLRWVRASLLGRIPGWTPPIPAVGPWRPIVLEQRSLAMVDDVDVKARVDGRGRVDGVVDVRITLRPLRGRVEGAVFVVGEAQAELVAHEEDDRVVLTGTARVPNVALWWPHTHGEPARHEARVGVIVDGASLELHLGLVGFRTIAVDTSDGGFTLSVNGERVFCRGVCATVSDLASLAATPDEHRASLLALREAGVNMIRVGGTMIYEDDAFYALCDELGILVWQDFMFANMDYPATDEAFLASVRREARQFLSRTQLSASVAVLCGNSEGEQQAAMLGLPREQWSSALFREVLPAVAAELRPDVPYWPSSASGGALPFHPGAGTSSYYGVGAYLRPLSDARASDVRFTTECLAFANVPREETIEAMLGDGEAPFHHPAWKAGVPRDTRAGWDFEDVRDHYLASLFGVDPMRLRYADMERYLARSRVVTGEAMASAFSEWRRRGSRCAGALVWFHRDLRPGAGWGIVDATGAPKAAYYAMKRVLQPIALVLTDEGLNGLALHAINETAAEIDVTVALKIYRDGESLVAEGATEITVGPRGVVELSGAGILGRFTDLTYAYRFGPPGHDLTVATMTCRRTGAQLGEAFHFPLGHSAFPPADLGLEAHAQERPDGSIEVTVRAARFAQAVALDARGLVASDDFFHIAPGGSHTVILKPLSTGALPRIPDVLSVPTLVPTSGAGPASMSPESRATSPVSMRDVHSPPVSSRGAGPWRGSVRALNGRGPVRVIVAEATGRA